MYDYLARKVKISVILKVLHKLKMTLEVGQKVPDFRIPNQEGKLIDLENIKSKYLILFFYPKDNTPGCTIEACSFRDNYKKLKELGAEIFGISSDTVESHKNFALKYDLPFTLLSDKGGNLRDDLYVPKAFGIFPGRSTYILDKKGNILFKYTNLLNGKSHVTESISFLKSLT
tara:strand:+ start:840 stop:1358 length:519 start_codon:yes stop_codon:yes gene_type:complete